MIDGGKKLANIGLPNVGKAARELLTPVDGEMSAAAGPAGVGIRDKDPLEDRFEDLDEGMVHHAVAIRCGTDPSLFGLEDAELSVGPRSVEAVDEFALQSQKFGLKVEFEACDGRDRSFAAAGCPGRRPEIVEADKLRPEVTMAFHGVSAPAGLFWRAQPPTMRPISSS